MKYSTLNLNNSQKSNFHVGMCNRINLSDNVGNCTPEARSLRLHTVARFIDWPWNCLIFWLSKLNILLIIKNFSFVADIANM